MVDVAERKQVLHFAQDDNLRQVTSRTMLAGMGDAGDDGAMWTAVDAYLADHLIAKDEVLEAALRDSEAAELPAIQVTALQGKMLQMFARMVGARQILEVGTLGGYSTIWLARALPEGGRLVTLKLPKGKSVLTVHILTEGNMNLAYFDFGTGHPRQ